MKKIDNHERAKKTVESWPAWKKEVSLTKYSCSTQNLETESRKSRASKK